MMRSFIRGAGIFIVAAGLGVLLAPNAHLLTHQAGEALHEQTRDVLAQAQTFVAGASPTWAAHLATILIIGAASAALLIAYLVVSVPIRLASMQRQIRRQKEEISSLRGELQVSSELLREARRDLQLQRERIAQPSLEAVPPVSARVDRFIFPQGVPDAPPRERRDL